MAVRVPVHQEDPRLALLPSGVSPFLSKAEPHGPGARARAALCLGGTDTSAHPSEKPPPPHFQGAMTSMALFMYKVGQSKAARALHVTVNGGGCFHCHPNSDPLGQGEAWSG